MIFSNSLYTKSLNYYLAEIKKIPKISKDEELACFKRYRESNDLNSIHRIITAHLRFVVYSVKSYKSCGINLVDLIQEGNIAVMKAAKKYNPEEYPNNRFISFAAKYIKFAIGEYITNFNKLIKFATTKSRRKLVQNGGKFDTLDYSNDNINKISEQLNVNKRDISEYFKWKNCIVHEDENEDIFSSCIVEFDDSLDEDKLSQLLADNLQKIPTRELNIIKERFFNDEPKTYQQIGTEMGISLQRVKQLEIQAINRLKEYFKEYEII